MSDATLMQITCRVNASHALRVAGCLQMSSFSRRKQSPDSSPPQEVLPLWSSTSQEIVSWLLFLDGFFYILLISPAYTVFLFYSWCPVIFFWALTACHPQAVRLLSWALHWASGHSSASTGEGRAGCQPALYRPYRVGVLYINPTNSYTKHTKFIKIIIS